MDERQAQDTPTEAKPGDDTAHAASELDGMVCCSDGVLGATDGGFTLTQQNMANILNLPTEAQMSACVELCQLVCTS